jgi:hypothetical protein
MKYYLFLDETGDHGLSFIDENFPIFMLVGILISEKDYIDLSDKANSFKEKFFDTTEVILHSRDIRKIQGPFQILFDLDLKKDFYEDLNQILQDGEYKILGVGVDKQRHIERYGKTADNPYSLSLSFLIERLVFACDSLKDCSEVEIVIEKRGNKEDAQLLSQYNKIIDKGTVYVTPERINRLISDFDFDHKRNNEIGLQIADLCAYPVARHALNPEVPNPAFDIIKDKVRDMCNGGGVKLFP